MSAIQVYGKHCGKRRNLCSAELNQVFEIQESIVKKNDRNALKAGYTIQAISPETINSVSQIGVLDDRKMLMLNVKFQYPVTKRCSYFP